MKRLVLLGASGSIGLQTIDVISQHPDRFSLEAFGVGRNINAARTILRDHPVPMVCVEKAEDAKLLQGEYPHIHFVYGKEGMNKIVTEINYDVFVNALVGFAGLEPTLRAIESGHDVALANKETLVVGGELINRALIENHVRLYPIDSEHSAIFQCLQGSKPEEVRKLIITASGGAFRKLSRRQLDQVTVRDALAHPNWSMGAKITIDSATMMNKGFEIMEAHWLFAVPYARIESILHEESNILSMVEFIDGAVLAQMGVPDMRLPIQYALTYPDRLNINLQGSLDLAKAGTLHFAAMDEERFPLIPLTYTVAKKGGSLPAVLNGANEVANLAFRQEKIGFLRIEDIIRETLDHCAYRQIQTLEDLIESDREARDYAESLLKV